jgi:hypothetical protein
MGLKVDPGPDFLAKWQLSSLLGEGGMGAVYLAEPLTGGPAVAAKFLSKRADDEALQRFARESQALRKVRHPHVVEVIATGEHDGHPWIVLEYVAGGSLAARLKQPPRLTPAEAARFADDILSGLVACHAAGILHRDLKPGNVLLTLEGRAKIADLGIAYDEGRTTQLTAIGSIIGTPLYMAPEVLVDGQSWSPVADVYSAGVVLYEMLADRTPVQGKNLAEIVGRHGVPRGALAQRAPEVPAALAALADRATARRPEERPPTAAAFLEELRAVAPVMALVTSPTGPDPDAKPPPPARRQLILGGSNLPAPAPVLPASGPVPSVVPEPAPAPVALRESAWAPLAVAVFVPVLAAIAFFVEDWFFRAWCGVAAAFFLTAVAKTAKRVARFEQAITIDENGFEDHRLGIGPVPWSEVRAIDCSKKGSAMTVRVGLADHQRYGDTTIFERLAGKLERRSRGGILYLNTATLSIPAAELARLLDVHWRAAKRALPQRQP